MKERIEPMSDEELQDRSTDIEAAIYDLFSGNRLLL